MNKPFIMIDGAKIEPAEPKMKVWRAFLKASEIDVEETMESFMDRQIGLIVLGFGKPDIVNAESIDNNLAVSEVVPTVRAIFDWIQGQTFARLSQVPKGEEKA